jgi:Family of unknown function (DUF6455)
MSMTLTPHPLRHNQNVQHHVVADFRSGAFNLLLMRMEALQLDPDEVRRIEARVFAEFARACANCESKGRCEQDLGSAGAVEHDSEGYCPNAETLSALATLPWFGKARTKAAS